MITAGIAFLVAVNPGAAAVALARDWRTDRPAPVALGTGLAVVLIAALAGLADPVLDALDINLGTYRLGAGVVVAVAGLRSLVERARRGADEPTTDVRLAGYVFFPTLVTPGAAVLSISVGAEEGLLTAALAAAIAIVAGGLGVYYRRRIPALLAGALTRLLGAGAVIVGVALAFDGIKTL